MVDTPNAALGADFSPMGPSSFHGFPEEGPPDPFEAKVRMTKSPQQPTDPTRRRPEESPFTGFINDFSPLPEEPLQGVARSPVRTDRKSRAAASRRGTRSSSRSSSRGRAIFASPVASDTKPKRLWQDPASSGPGPMRLELGHMGARPSSTQKTLEGINSRMRSQPGPSPPAAHHPLPPPPQQRTPASSPFYAPHPPPVPPGAFRPDLSTPIKAGALFPSPGMQSAIRFPGSGGKPLPPAGFVH